MTIDPTKLGKFLGFVVTIVFYALVILGSLFGLGLAIDGLGEILARELSR